MSYHLMRKSISVNLPGSVTDECPIYIEIADADIGAFAPNVGYVWFSQDPAIHNSDSTPNSTVTPVDWEVANITNGVFNFKGYVTYVPDFMYGSQLYVYASKSPPVLRHNLGSKYFVGNYDPFYVWHQHYDRVFHLHDTKDGYQDTQALDVYSPMTINPTAGLIQGNGDGSLLCQGGSVGVDPLLYYGLGEYTPTAFEFWFNPGVSMLGGNEYVIAAWANAGGQFSWKISITPQGGNNWQFRLSDFNSPTGTISSNKYLVPGWHHLGFDAAVSTGWTGKLYLDGYTVPIVTHLSGSVVRPDASRLHIGGMPTGANFLGYIDEFRILDMTSVTDPVPIFENDAYCPKNLSTFLLGAAEYFADAWVETGSGGVKTGGLSINAKYVVPKVYNEVGYGTIRLGGTSPVDSAKHFNETGRGGVRLVSIALPQFVYAISSTSGVVALWDLSTRYSEIASGGINLGGTLAVNKICNTWLSEGVFTVIATGTQVIPPQNHVLSAGCYFQFNESTNTMWYYIRFPYTGFDAARIRIGAIGEEGVTIAAIDTPGVPLGMTAEGTFTLTNTQKDEYHLGRLYIYLREDALNVQLRSQIKPYTGISLGGETHETTPMQGGISVSGSAAELHRVRPPISGGIQASGEALVTMSWSIHRILGGTRVGGSGGYQKLYDEASTGNIVVNGSIGTNHDQKEVGTGGILLSGMLLVGISPAISGGISSGGIVREQWLAVPVISGGLIFAGTGKTAFTDFAQFDTSSSPRFGGRARLEFIKHIVPLPQKNRGRCLSPNITQTEPVVTRLITPATGAPLAARANPYQKPSGEWCDVKDRCEEGVLPIITKRRQTPYLPPKMQRIRRLSRS